MQKKKYKISEIKLNPDNPRFIRDKNFEKLVTSMKEFPEMIQARPIIINQENVILGGNMRFRAMKEAGWKETEAVKVDWDKKKQEEFILKDNLALGEWDWEQLANEWDVDTLSDWGFDSDYLFGRHEFKGEESEFVNTDDETLERKKAESRTKTTSGVLVHIGEFVGFSKGAFDMSDKLIKRYGNGDEAMEDFLEDIRKKLL